MRKRLPRAGGSQRYMIAKIMNATERARRAAAAHDWALVVWVVFCVVVVGAYVLWGEALVRYLLGG